jgi:hypothetical protein
MMLEEPLPGESGQQLDAEWLVYTGAGISSAEVEAMTCREV